MSKILICDIIIDKQIIKNCDSWPQPQIEQQSEPRKCPEFL